MRDSFGCVFFGIRHTFYVTMEGHLGRYSTALALHSRATENNLELVRELAVILLANYWYMIGELQPICEQDLLSANILQSNGFNEIQAQTRETLHEYMNAKTKQWCMEQKQKWRNIHAKATWLKNA